MEKMRLAISLSDGQTIFADPRPEDEPELTQLAGVRTAIDIAARDDDLEGHAFSTDIAVDVEGHAMVLRLPQASDAAALRRALAVGAVTATLVGTGLVAGLHPQAPSAATGVQAPPRAQVQPMAGPAIRAQQDEMQRQAAQEDYLRQQKLQTVPLDATNPAIPAQALRAEQAEMQREAAQENMVREQQLRAVPADADNPAVPPQAERAGTD
jgi:hypothetical protein